MSRDYFARPIRTSRDGDYGNTRLGETEHPWRGQFWRMLGVTLLAAAALFAFGLALRAMGGG